MSNEVVTVTVKGIGDFSDVVSNVGSVQKALTKLKLPDKLGEGLSKNINAFMSEYEKYQKKISEGVKTQGDYNQVEKSLNRMRSLYQEIGKDTQKLTKLDMEDMLNLDTGEFKKITSELTNIIKQIGGMKFDTSPFTKAFADIRKITKSTKVTGDNGILSQMIGNINSGQINEAKKQLQELQAYANKVAPRQTAEGKQAPGTLSPEKYAQLTSAINIMSQAFDKADSEMAPFIQKQNELQKELEETKQKAAQGLKNEFNQYNQASKDVDSVTESLKRMHQEEFSFNREAQNIDRQIQSYFGLSQMIRKVGDIAKDAFSTVKELDKAMTQTAVVTNFSVGDMWEMLPTYTAQANQLGSTIQDVYEAATLYYQQGLNTNQAMSLANETLKMARIAGLDAADATNMMTAALRGFNMEINQMSAQKVNDVYSELAAITASDTKEIGSAMERTASIANSANMEFETTSAFLAQMIETTREAPENLGTAMKTIVARFQEMKQDPTKLVDSEGVAMDANKVDKALKTIGVDLMNTKGEFRDLDDVFLDISAKWDSLTQGQQRYIATIAAGSRQQSRFIAMMSDHERTMELVDAANNSAGASQRQFEKTLDSMEAKLNKLKNAWDQFTMGLMNNQILKFGVDALTKGFTIVNKFIDLLGKLPPKPFEGITKSALTLVTTLGMLQFGKNLSRGLVVGGAAWWKGENSFTGGFSEGYKDSQRTSILSKGKPGEEGSIKAKATTDAMAYRAAVTNALNKGGLGAAIKQAWQSAGKVEFTNTFDAAFGQFNGARFAASWSDDIETEITRVLNSVIDDADEIGELTGQQFKAGLTRQLKEGEIGGAEFKAAIKEATHKDIGEIGVNPKEIGETADETQKLGDRLTSAGAALSDFGALLEGTPLAPFGALIQTIGMSLMSFGEAAAWVSATWTAGITTATGATLTGTAAMKAGFSALFTEIWAFLTTNPIGWILLAIAGIVAAVKGLDLLIESNAEKLEAVTNAAASASEAYDSAKQETSELADAIEQVKSNEDAFDGLVVGTAAFNEQLVAANDQIMELIKKYPMLNDQKYLSTDKHGLMHISDEGLDAVKEYQKQLQANASALNLIQTADLSSEENRQKADQMRKVRGTDTTETYRQRVKEADLIEQQAKAQQQMAKVNAINTALVDKEIANREKISAIMAEQYDARKEAINLEGESIHDLKQEYADFYGYKYDKSTKKLTDVEGNEIDVDKATVKDAVKEIRVITNLEVDGKSLDNMINHIDSTFSNALGDTFENSGSLFSDILSDNIDINDDLLQNLITNPDKLQSAVDALSEKEIAAVLGVSAEAVAQAPDKYKNELTDKLIEKATNIAETQAQSYADLASMLAQTSSAEVEKLIDKNGQATTNAQKANQQAIKEQLDNLTTEQKNTLSNIGNILIESSGADTMRTFIKQATDIYTKGTEKTITTLDNIIQDVNWTSPTARLKAYNNMIDSADKSIQTLGQDLRHSSESSNLLGEAFEEFYDSSDFQELAENMDSFVDASGKLDASSVQEMAQQCNSLNNLLDTGAISAGGVAAALNAMGADGNITILDLNENLLKFLSTANQLQDVLSEAHSLIENFDWGVDTGESEDFAIDSTKKWKELYDNGEFGNQQLENYAKFVLGQDRWNAELEKSGGNIEKALDSMSGDILKYSDGFEQAWVDMADSSSEKYQDVHYGDNGDIIWDTKGKTTQELVDWLAETRGITQEWAKLMVEDFANYSYDFKTELATNDFNAALEQGDYIKSRQGGNEAVNVTRSEIQALAAAQNKTESEIEASIAKAAGIEGQELKVLENVDKNGAALLDETSITDLNKQYSQDELGGTGEKSWLTQYQAEDRQGNVIEGSTDLKAAISGAIADGLPDQQATEMARVEAAQALADGAQVFYDGVELNKEDLADSQAFAEKIAEITENSRWTAVGQAIAQGYIDYIKSGTTPESNASELTTTGQENTSSEKKLTYEPDPYSEDQEELYSRGGEKIKEGLRNFWNGVKEGITSDQSFEDPKAAAAESARQRSQAVDDGLKEGVQTQTTDEAKNAGEQAARDGLDEYMNGLNQATPSIQPTPKVETDPSQTTPSIQPQETTLTVHTEDSELDGTKAKIDTVIQATAQPQTLTITANTGKSTNIALANINKIKEATKGTNSINVTAKVKGKEAVSNLSTVIENVQPKTISVTASVKGASKVTSLKNEINNLKDKDVYITTHKKTVKEGPGDAKGRNNKLPINHLPSLGSLAKGSQYGRLGPKGKGGLTLTGEKGFEIAWLPKESRSMILGVDGPQMINLPADAVVYTHEQSKDILNKRQTIDAGSHAGRHKKSGGSSSSKKSSKSSSKSKSKKKSKKKKSKEKKEAEEPRIVNYSIEETVRFNIDQELAKLTYDINKRAKTIEKTLSRVGTTSKSIEGSITNQLEALKKQKQANADLLASYQRQSNEILNWQEQISYQGYETKTTGKGKKKKTTTELTSKTMTINLRDYMIQQADGSYIANTGAIAAIGNKEQQKGIQDAVNNAVSSLNSGMIKAKEAMDEVDEKMEELENKLYEAFNRWEKSINAIYLISQKLEAINKRKDIRETQIDLALTKLQAGFEDAGTSISALASLAKKSMNELSQSIEGNYALITERYKEYNKLLQLSTYKEFENSTEGQDKYLAGKIALELYQSMNGDMTQALVGIKDAIAKYEEQGYTNVTDKAVEEVLNTIQEGRNNLYEAIDTTLSDISSAFDKLIDYQETIKSFEDTLLEGLEQQTEDEIDELSNLSDAISNALKDLLDEVRQRLEDRRRTEDNAKTEDDIARKQQRLATLRANTSGGNQVEIKQLEKEIADAQQSYQRTLEDQLLDKLQRQGDEAAKQRERQIELLEAIKDAATSDNRKEVEKWLSDPETYKNEIYEVWKKAKDYDSETTLGQQLLDNEFNRDFTEVAVALSQVKFNDHYNNIEDSLDTIIHVLLNGPDISDETVSGFLEELANVDKTAENAKKYKALNYTATDLKNAGWKLPELKEAGFTGDELKEAGFTPTDFRSAYDLPTIRSYFSPKELKDNGFTLDDFATMQISYDEAKAAGWNRDTELATHDYYKASALEDINKELLKQQQDKEAAQSKYEELINKFVRTQGWYSPNALKELLDAGQALGKQSYDIGLDIGQRGLKYYPHYDSLWYKNHWFLDKHFYKQKGVDYSTLQKIDDGIRRGYEEYKYSRYKKNPLYGFATGGLNTSTGPAWLDGTPSKPELVLNAQDTKNFIALKDVLSRAMSNTKDMGTSYGDMVYEVNINVDKITSDYDVDKMAERVKKIIVKDSTYRNVTQVRKFR